MVKESFHFLLHLKQGQGFTPVYPSLRTENIPLSCTYDFDQDPSIDQLKKNDHPCKNHDATIDTTSFFDPPGKDLQPSSDQECPPLPFELTSLNSISIGQYASMSLSPTTLELK